MGKQTFEPNYNKARRNASKREERALERFVPVRNVNGSKTSCGKRGFKEEIDAKIALASTQSKKNSKREECRIYLCPSCNNYHLTSSPLYSRRRDKYNMR